MDERELDKLADKIEARTRHTREIFLLLSASVFVLIFAMVMILVVFSRFL